MIYEKPKKKDFEPSGKTEITFEGVELIRNDEIFRDQGKDSLEKFACFLLLASLTGGYLIHAKMQHSRTSLIFQHQFLNQACFHIDTYSEFRINTA